MSIKVTHLNFIDTVGGAARATYRIHNALQQIDVHSRMLVDKKTSADWTVETINPKWKTALNILKRQTALLHKVVYRTENPIIHSPAIFSSGTLKKLNTLDTDILHLHWVQGEMLSIKDISHLQKPLVWTLHDMWAFCGAEHYTEDLRWKDEYLPNHRPAYEKGFDLNRWVWKRKQKHWVHPIQIVTPSHWLANCVRNSALMRDWPVEVIANPIDISYWKPTDKNSAREKFHLPQHKSIILFGAIGGVTDLRKGFDLLKGALQHLQNQCKDIELVIFGESEPEHPPHLGFPIHYVGELRDDLALSILYNAADIFVLPSRNDNLPNTVVEATCCGIPSVAFNIGGLPDIIEHKKTGYLANAFDHQDLAEGIKWILNLPADEYQNMRHYARKKAVDSFDSKIIAKKYEALYQSVLDRK